MNEDNGQPLEIVQPSALEVMERAQTDVQINTAKRYPRRMAVVKQDMLSLATLDEETAASCFYTLKRKDSNEPTGYKVIQGPSARLAEIAANSFGNMKAAARIIGNDGKMITAQAVCHDLEKNVCIAVEVKRRITNRDGRTFSDDMQVVTGNAACSIALRNAVFKVIPMALVKPIYEAAKKTAVGDAKTLADRRAKCISIFEDMGVSKARVFAAVGKAGIEDIGLSELEVLIGMHTAIKDGDGTAEELFPDPTTKPKNLATTPAPSLFAAGSGAAPKPEPPAKLGPVTELRERLAQSKITESALINFMHAEGAISDETLSTLDDVEKIQPDAIAGAIENWAEIEKSLKPTPKKKAAQ